MISAIVTTVYSIILVVASFLYLKSRYRTSEKCDVKTAVKKHIGYILLTVVVFGAITAVQIWYSLRHDMYALPNLLKWATLYWGMFLLAKIDFHEKKIPNKIVLVMLLIRAVFLVYEIIVSHGYLKTAVGYPLLGAAIGGLVMAAGMLISRKGVGMGDVKMFIVIGWFVGSNEILATMFCILVLSAIGGLGLMLFKKAGLKDSIPMAPFAFAGVAVEYLLLMVGG